MTLDQFYTNHNIAVKCLKTLNTHINYSDFDYILEPSAGTVSIDGLDVLSSSASSFAFFEAYREYMGRYLLLTANNPKAAVQIGQGVRRGIENNVIAQDRFGDLYVFMPTAGTPLQVHTKSELGGLATEDVSDEDSRVYIKKGYPLKIISNFENWSKISDVNGIEGWISNSQLSEKKYVIITSNNEFLYKFPNIKSKKIAKVMKNFVLENKKCNASWCFVKEKEIAGWVRKKGIWGN